MPADQEWVYLYHPEALGGAQFPNDPAVIAVYEGKGWVRQDTPAELDPDAPNTGLTAEQANAQAAAAQAAEEAEALKGKALDEALEAAGLSKAGTADEKRARLAEHEAESVNNNEGDEQ
jgi:hypothetical protein